MGNYNVMLFLFYSYILAAKEENVKYFNVMTKYYL